MQNSNGTTSTERPFPLSPQERFDQLAASFKRAEREEEKHTQFKDEVNALEINPNARVTFSGKVIQNNRGHHSLPFEENKPIRQVFCELALAGISLEALRNFAPMITSLANVFAPSVAAKEPVSSDIVKDKFNSYETELVTHATYKKIKEECDYIAQRERAIEQIQDPDIYMCELQDFAEYANSLDMRPHPVTGEFVHSLERVRILEKENMSKTIAVEPAIHKVEAFSPLPKLQAPSLIQSNVYTRAL